MTSHELEAFLGESLSDEDYYVNKARVDKINKQDEWTAFNISLNAGHRFSFGSDAQEAERKKLLERKILTVEVDEDEKTVRLISGADTVVYTVDISELLAQKTPEQVVEAYVGFGARQLVVLLISNDIDLYPHFQRPYFLSSADLNPNGLPECATRDYDSTFRREYFCQRPEGHLGEHQVLTNEIGSYAQHIFSKDGASRSWEWMFGLPTPCKECGFILDGSSEVCFTCSYWSAQKVANKDSFIIGGVHYRPGKGGFGGRTFEIERTDGTKWSGELFTQGKIPPHFRDRFPDNAVFLNTASPTSVYFR